eukprot:GILJ01007768.1.p1 GENE.GILJ01007768.1~~GILJ01007768.1.p1  ORF type:complete len:397 (+),score=35.23 GILJ01007768.1:43-1233(+)
MFLLGISLYFGVGAVVLAALFCGHPSGTGPLDVVHRLLFVHAKNLIKSSILLVCGQRMVNKLENFWFYLCFTNHPLLQFFYLILVIGGFFVYWTYGFIHIPGPYVDAYHEYIGYFLVTLCLYSFMLAVFADPGVITRENIAEHKHTYPYDNVIFSESVCETCDILKPARSKHCRLCDHCVAKFDHHCVWINRCIGENNYRHFMFFLITHAVLCIYGGFLGIYIVVGIVEQTRLFEASFMDKKTNQVTPATPTVIVQYMIYHYGPIIFMTFLCLVMGAVLFLFFVHHLYIAAQNTTTNERYKWSELYDSLRTKQAATDTDSVVPKSSAGSTQSATQRNEAARLAKPRQKENNITNLYDRGLWANWMEVLLPLSQRSDAPRPERSSERTKHSRKRKPA